MLKDLFILEMFIFLSWRFGHEEKPLYKKAKVNFEIYDVTDWKKNNDNTHIAQQLRK